MSAYALLPDDRDDRRGIRLETNAGNSGEITIDCQIDGNTGAIVGINASQSVEITNGIFQWHNGTMLHRYGVA